MVLIALLVDCSGLKLSFVAGSESIHPHLQALRLLQLFVGVPCPCFSFFRVFDLIFFLVHHYFKSILRLSNFEKIGACEKIARGDGARETFARVRFSKFSFSSLTLLWQLFLYYF